MLSPAKASLGVSWVLLPDSRAIGFPSLVGAVVRPACAGGALAVELQVVGGDGEAGLLRDGAAGRGHRGRRGAGHVDRAAAAVAHDVVVRGGVAVVPRARAVTEAELERVAGLDEQAEAAVDGRRPDAGVPLPNPVEDLGCGRVISAGAQDVEDG